MGAGGTHDELAGSHRCARHTIGHIDEHGTFRTSEHATKRCVVVADGPIYIVFGVVDTAGNVAWSPTRVVMVDNTKPQVRFINPSPWPNKLVIAPETVSADVTESAPLRFLALYVNTMFYAAATEADPSVTFDPTGYTGPVTLKWVAVDIAGNRGVVTRTVQT